LTTKEPAKDFDEIADDYAFFERHATEAEAGARAHLNEIAGVTPADGMVKFLDFGCGSGTFTARLLDQTDWPPSRLSLMLVDPAQSARRQAVSRLAPYTTFPIVESPTLPTAADAGFDVVLANHVLNYVPDLQRTVSQLRAVLAPAGVLLIAIGKQIDVFNEFLNYAFGLLGRASPYNCSDDVDAALRAVRANYDKHQVAFELSFPDSEENRRRMLRFLLADHFAQMPHEPLMEWFNQFSRAGRIEIRSYSEHYVVRP